MISYLTFLGTKAFKFHYIYIKFERLKKNVEK
jgi:hypothetical protein